jgi:hypothetical protein
MEKKRNPSSEIEYSSDATIGNQKYRAGGISSAAEPALSETPLRQRIAKNAYELYLRRGQIHGHDVDDWLEAERYLLDQLKAPVAAKKARKPRTGRRRVG